MLVKIKLAQNAPFVTTIRRSENKINVIEISTVCAKKTRVATFRMGTCTLQFGESSLKASLRPEFTNLQFSLAVLGSLHPTPWITSNSYQRTNPINQMIKLMVCYGLVFELILPIPQSPRPAPTFVNFLSSLNERLNIAAALAESVLQVLYVHVHTSR